MELRDGGENGGGGGGLLSSFPRTRNKHVAEVVYNQGWPTEGSCQICRD